MELVSWIRSAYAAEQLHAAERAQQVLYYRHYDRIEKILRWKLPEQLDDLAVEKTHVVFEKALTSIVAGKKIDEFSPWLFGVAQNVVRDYYRSREYQEFNEARSTGGGYRETDDGGRATYAEPSTLGDSGEWETLDVIERWFSRHQDSHRRIVELYVLQGYTAAETAGMTGETEANVYQVAKRFRDDLDRLLAGEDFDAPHDSEDRT